MDLAKFKQELTDHLDRLVNSTDDIVFDHSIEIVGDQKYIACEEVIIDGINLKKIPRGPQTVAKRSLMPIIRLGKLESE